jgi:hypothetical protein
MANKEIITENELLELANRYIQLEQEFEEYRNEFKYCIKDMEYCFNEARAGDELNYLRGSQEPKYFTFDDYINRFKK